MAVVNSRGHDINYFSSQRSVLIFHSIPSFSSAFFIAGAHLRVRRASARVCAAQNARN